MESDLAIFASQMHNIKVRYHIVGKQEELQEIYDLYQTFIQKERPAMEEDEADDWEGNIILALGVDYGTCNLENETYVTNDADGKHFHDLPDDHFIAPLDY